MTDYCFGPPIAAGPADVSSFETDEELAMVARSLAHPVRISIIRLLARHQVCTGADLFPEIDLAQSTVSEHVRILKEAGIVGATASGNHMCYCLIPGALLRTCLSLSELPSGGRARETVTTKGCER